MEYQTLTQSLPDRGAHDKLAAIMETTFQDEWNQAVAFLAASDPVLQPVLEAYKGEILHRSPDALSTLMNAVVGQQVSVHAAEAIWQRLLARFKGRGGVISGPRLAAASDEELRACGLSRQKIAYLRGIVQEFREGFFSNPEWRNLDDASILQHLVKLKGVGTWTAHMLMIFHLGRLDILPDEDLGLIKSFKKVYGFDGIDREGLRRRLREQAQLWRPYRTVATWYLWRVLDPLVVAY